MPTEVRAQVDNHSFLAHYFSAATPSKQTLLFCLPGGGASKDYFDLAPDYSFARRMSAAGYDVITMDHPGTATNTLPADHPFFSPRQSAGYIAAAIPQFRDTLDLSSHSMIGAGHSMGGMITVLIQARHRPFSSIALFGSSAGGLDWGLDDHEKAYIDREEKFAENLETLTLRKFKVPFPPSMGGPSGKSITFGGENDAITQRLRETTCNLYAAGGMMSMTRGSFKSEVLAIDVPIFFAFGDHDIGIPPDKAPDDFINVPSYEVVLLDNTGHNSFAFSSIKTLCERFCDWA